MKRAALCTLLLLHAPLAALAETASPPARQAPASAPVWMLNGDLDLLTQTAPDAPATQRDLWHIRRLAALDALSALSVSDPAILDLSKPAPDEPDGGWSRPITRGELQESLRPFHALAQSHQLGDKIRQLPPPAAADAGQTVTIKALREAYAFSFATLGKDRTSVPGIAVKVEFPPPPAAPEPEQTPEPDLARAGTAPPILPNKTTGPFASLVGTWRERSARSDVHTTLHFRSDQSGSLLINRKETPLRWSSFGPHLVVHSWDPIDPEVISFLFARYDPKSRLLWVQPAGKPVQTFARVSSEDPPDFLQLVTDSLTRKALLRGLAEPPARIFTADSSEQLKTAINAALDTPMHGPASDGFSLKLRNRGAELRVIRRADGTAALVLPTSIRWQPQPAPFIACDEPAGNEAGSALPLLWELDPTSLKELAAVCRSQSLQTEEVSLVHRSTARIEHQRREWRIEFPSVESLTAFWNTNYGMFLMNWDLWPPFYLIEHRPTSPEALAMLDERIKRLEKSASLFPY